MNAINKETARRSSTCGILFRGSRTEMEREEGAWFVFHGPDQIVFRNGELSAALGVAGAHLSHYRDLLRWMTLDTAPDFEDATERALVTGRPTQCHVNLQLDRETPEAWRATLVPIFCDKVQGCVRRGEPCCVLIGKMSPAGEE